MLSSVEVPKKFRLTDATDQRTDRIQSNDTNTRDLLTVNLIILYPGEQVVKISKFKLI